MKKQSCTPKKPLILFNIYDLKCVTIICVIKCLWEIANLQASAKCCFLFSSKSVISILQSVGNINLIYVGSEDLYWLLFDGAMEWPGLGETSEVI